MTASATTAPAIDQAGRPARRFLRDRVGAAAVALIGLAVAVRAWVASRGFLIFDDFMLASRAVESNLSVGHLFAAVNEHVMPAGVLIIWLVTRAVGIAHWPYVILLALGYTVLGVTFYRLLGWCCDRVGVSSSRSGCSCSAR